MYNTNNTNNHKYSIEMTMLMTMPILMTMHIGMILMTLITPMMPMTPMMMTVMTMLVTLITSITLILLMTPMSHDTNSSHNANDLMLQFSTIIPKTPIMLLFLLLDDDYGDKADNTCDANDTRGQCYKTFYHGNLLPFLGNTIILCYKALLPW
jgi:hypothetical protein